MRRRSTSIRVREDVRDRLKQIAESRGISIGCVVEMLLNEQDVVEKLSQIISLLEENNQLLKDLIRVLGAQSIKSVEVKREARTISMPSISEPELPSYLVDNPWVEVLKRRITGVSRY